MLGSARFWWSEVWLGAYDPEILSVKAGLALKFVPSKQIAVRIEERIQESSVGQVAT